MDAARRASELAAAISARVKKSEESDDDEVPFEQDELVQEANRPAGETDFQEIKHLDVTALRKRRKIHIEDPLEGFLSSFTEEPGNALRKRRKIHIEDPLDGFLSSFTEEPENSISYDDIVRVTRPREIRPKPQKMRFFNDDAIDERKIDDSLEVFAEQLRKKELKPVDHSSIEYPTIRKNLYVVPKKLFENADERRRENQIKVRGKACPPPVESWSQCGLSRRIDELLPYEKPFPIQQQALPCLMSGRDVIGVAKTGSGKTLAFVLPLLRHVDDQPRVDGGEGPIGLIMAPARELALQIYREVKKYSSHRTIAVYGGARVSGQIADLKRGAEVCVCTPGRLIDLLTMQQGRMLSLRRTSFVILDEADRMFDMGFEPQITMILRSVRPDRQTAMFSATFPRAIEQLARTTLTHPIEIVVGGKSVADSITQYVEVRDEATKFMRLLQLLGVWHERGSILIFVDTQAKCDSIYRDLLKAGYACLSLHGGHEQTDRETTIRDFKHRVANVMVATSVAGRGLDVTSIVCVVNYSTPNHAEDYVHRVGRTGRAGRRGTAYTFVDPTNEEPYAPLLVKALVASKQTVPFELKKLADDFKKKAGQGEAKWASSGYVGNRGYSFDELTAEQQLEKQQKDQFQVELGLKDDELLFDDDDDDDETSPPQKEVVEETKPADALAAALTGGATESTHKAALATLAHGPASNKNLTPVERAKILAATFGKAQRPALTALERARALAASIGGGQTTASHFMDELDINDFPPEARVRATNRENILRVAEETGAAIIARGVYCPPGKIPMSGDKRLCLAIEGPSEFAVKAAKSEMLRCLNEETRSVAIKGRATYGKYSLI